MNRNEEKYLVGDLRMNYNVHIRVISTLGKSTLTTNYIVEEQESFAFVNSTL